MFSIILLEKKLKKKQLGKLYSAFLSPNDVMMNDLEAV